MRLSVVQFCLWVAVVSFATSFFINIADGIYFKYSWASIIKSSLQGGLISTVLMLLIALILTEFFGDYFDRDEDE